MYYNIWYISSIFIDSESWETFFRHKRREGLIVGVFMTPHISAYCHVLWKKGRKEQPVCVWVCIRNFLQRYKNCKSRETFLNCILQTLPDDIIVRAWIIIMHGRKSILNMTWWQSVTWLLLIVTYEVKSLICKKEECCVGIDYAMRLNKTVIPRPWRLKIILS